ncbi:hypothetical protein CEXT_282101 [Caerostris extrusa]|uniref:Uncharacterized protein n=1 Tax=Caerostris extrusa TaxID=172846 RepID=A0AAV4MTX4_CAEEX|nr:hypothetical protein CEXT_282101 [Caerostris extrusa]
MCNFFRITPSASPLQRGKKNNNNIHDFLSKRNCCNCGAKTRQPLLKLHHCEHGFTGGKSSPANSSSKEGGNLSVFRDIICHLLPVTGDLTPPRVREGVAGGGRKWRADKV